MTAVADLLVEIDEQYPRNTSIRYAGALVAYINHPAPRARYHIYGAKPLLDVGIAIYGPQNGASFKTRKEAIAFVRGLVTAVPAVIERCTAEATRVAETLSKEQANA